MRISEIFESFQGEGIFTGMPALFVRLGGCNLDCEWCDTDYAKKKFKDLNLEEVTGRINSSKMENVVITGGEPLLQAEELLKLISGVGKKLFLETNGTLYNKRLLEKFNFISISPKLSSSKNRDAVKIGVLKRYVRDFSDKMQLKFVISDEKDLMEMRGLLKALGIGKKIPVVVQPNGRDILGYGRESRKLLNMVLESDLKEWNIRFMLQTHKILGVK